MVDRTGSNALTENSGCPCVGEKAPDFLVNGPRGRTLLSELSHQVRNLVLISQDSYRYHDA